MRTCQSCGGGIAEPGEVTSWAGKWCHCFIERGYRTDPAIHIGPVPGGQVPYPNPYKPKLDEMEEFQKKWKDNVHKPTYSHIIGLCEQLSLAELKALIGLLSQLHDSAALASNAGHFETKGSRE